MPREGAAPSNRKRRSMFRSLGIAQCVMAGLVPATHALLGCTKDVGARHKAGHDDGEIVRQPDRKSALGLYRNAGGYRVVRFRGR
jgi:hypothetical protein